MPDKIIALARPEHSIENIKDIVADMLEYAQENDTVLMIAVTLDRDDIPAMWVASNGEASVLRGLGAIDWLKDTFRNNE